MARKQETVHDIKDRISALKDELKANGRLSKAKLEQLKTLRATHKEIKGLDIIQQKTLKGALQQNDIEKRMLRNAALKGKQEQNLAKLQSQQIKMNIKAVQGQLTSVDIAEQMNKIKGMELQAHKLIKKGEEDRGKDILAQTQFLTEQLNQSEDISKHADARAAAEEKLDSLSGGLITKYKGLKKAQELWNLAAAKHPLLILAVVVLAIGAAIVKAAKATLELKKEFGLSVVETMQLQSTLMTASAELKMMGVSAENVKATAGALIEEFGEISNITHETVVALGGMETTIGLAGKEAVQLLGAMEGVSGSSREAVISQIESFGAMAKSAKVAPAAVMKDLADNTDMFADFAQDGGENLAKAAIQANKLGINMGVVSKMAESLLDFESSIESQMEASMMIGRQINTDKARQLLMAGDMAGMQEEVMKQLGTEAEFNQMNVLQRQALGKAFGLSTGELSKMVRDQEELNNLTDEELAMRDKQAELSKQTTKAMESAWKSVQEAFQPVIQHMQEVFLTWMPLIGPLFKFIGATMKVAFLPLRLAFAILKPIIQLLGFLLKPIIDFGAALVDYVVVPFQGLMSIIEWIVNKVSALGGLFTGIFGGGGTTVNTTGTVSAAEGGTFTAPTNVNVADAGKPETVIPLDPAGIKVNNEDLLEKMDQLISAMGGVKNEVREMGVK